VSEVDCQTGELLRSSKKYPRLFTRFYQLRSNIKEHGFLGTSRKAWSKFVSGTEAIGAQPIGQLRENENGNQVLGLQPGEVVEVKAEEEIRRTLDAAGKHRGLGFMPEMWEYCGQRRQVFKRVEKICLEDAPRTVRAMKHTVLLEGAVCKGGGIGCDRACFYFWRECWLRRVPSLPVSPGSDARQQTSIATDQTPSGQALAGQEIFRILKSAEE